MKAQIAEEHVQKSLFERHKKYEANTTFLPRLDGALAQGSSTNSSVIAGSGHESNYPPGRAVKSIAAELERFEMDSGTFPEEPILRSRSAKQPQRVKNGNAPRSDSLPAIRGIQASNPVTRYRHAFIYLKMKMLHYDSYLFVNIFWVFEYLYSQCTSCTKQ